MKYDDFQILDDTSYATMREEYSSSLFDRRDTLDKIIAELNEAKNLCFGANKNYNRLLQEAILSTQTIVLKNIENLTTTFNLKTPQKFEIQEFNIFTLIKALTKLQKLLLNWERNETKDYYKAISKNTTEEIIDANLNLIHALEKSKIVIFKHM